VGFQTRDLLEAMISDWADGAKGGVLRVDGGMSASNWTMQFLSNILNAPVDRPEVLETTAMGAAWLAGMRVGVYPEQGEFAKSWSLEKRFQPQMDNDQREKRYEDWKSAMAATLKVRT
jgi:glycerol kinase